MFRDKTEPSLIYGKLTWMYLYIVGHFTSKLSELCLNINLGKYNDEWNETTENWKVISKKWNY